MASRGLFGTKFAKAAVTSAKVSIAIPKDEIERPDSPTRAQNKRYLSPLQEEPHHVTPSSIGTSFSNTNDEISDFYLPGSATELASDSDSSDRHTKHNEANKLWDLILAGESGIVKLMEVVKLPNIRKLINQQIHDQSYGFYRGENSLTLAAQVQNEKALRILLGAGVFLEHRNNHAETALMISVNKRNSRNARLLLKSGANIGCTYQNGNTLLMQAISRQDIDLVSSLLKYKFNRKKVNKHGEGVRTLAYEMYRKAVNIKQRERAETIINLIQKNSGLPPLICRPIITMFTSVADRNDTSENNLQSYTQYYVR